MAGTVIIPLDGSKLSERALTFGVAIAERTGANVVLIRVARIGADEPELTSIRTYLHDVASRFPGQLHVETERGRSADIICGAAERWPDPMIVMSTRGHGGIHRWMTGSVADEVVRSAGIPVLLVRGDQELPRHDELELRAILVPVDGSGYSESAVPFAVEIAKTFNSKIHLLRVVDTPSAYAMIGRHAEAITTGNILDEIIDSMRREASEYLERLASSIREQEVEVRTVVLEGYPGDQVVEHERQGYFQLVVMATAGRSGVSRVVFGSVAERMLKLGRSPVMMVRPVKDGTKHR